MVGGNVRKVPTNPEVANQVEKMLRAVEKKLQMPEFGGIVEESLKCSIFGIFGKNFKTF